MHDRRPVVLSPEDVYLRLEQGISLGQAEHLARFAAFGSDYFEW
jgi:hypothetical protein